MYSLREIPSASSLFSTYASLSASLMLVRSAVNEFVPQPVLRYLHNLAGELFRQTSNKLTLIIEAGDGIAFNQVYEAAYVYLRTKISPSADRLRVTKLPKENHLTVSFEKGEKLNDVFEGIELNWRYVCVESEKRNNERLGSSSHNESRYFELTFDKKYKDRVLNSYLPHIMGKAEAIKEGEKVLKLCTLGGNCLGGKIYWDTIKLEHPSTFDTLAMDPELKKAIIDDLDRFVRRREFYKRVGRAWKRGYLLYGPPGTGKSSLIAAIANYLKFDIYDLQLGNLMHDSDLRRLLLTTANRSILVIEDIDCSVDLPDRKNTGGPKTLEVQLQLSDAAEEDRGRKKICGLTLSGLLNFIDGLWSSCGDERIIIFTTNHREKLDPALLRPGRMDMHIHMSYLTNSGFRVLASNYLGLTGYHRLFREIERLLETINITPAQVAEELMRSEDADVALQGVSDVLKRKKMEDEEVYGTVESLEGKRQKVESCTGEA
ncbi:hypothetical protein Ancab_003247 [Ancistrocladus abbreviatus]